jgi:hypothetical protein
MYARRALILAAATLVGCASTFDGWRFTKVGGVVFKDAARSEPFKRDPEFKMAGNLKVSPEDVAKQHGRLCGGRYYCSYFTDGRNYYLIADHGILPFQGSIAEVACPIVNGESGELLKRC